MSVKNLSDSDFHDFVKDGTAVVDFWATWCGPCRVFGPVFENVAGKMPNVNFGKFEVTDENKDTPLKYGIRSIPTVIAFKNGEVAEMKTGLMDEKMFEEWIKAML